jgi:hypothetical protein
LEGQLNEYCEGFAAGVNVTAGVTLPPWQIVAVEGVMLNEG